MCVYVCMYVCGFAHTHSYWSYFMAKLFREKNNSISRHTGYGSQHSRFCTRIYRSHLRIRNVNRRAHQLSLLALDIGARIDNYVKNKSGALTRKLSLPLRHTHLFCCILQLVYETRTMIRTCDKLFTRHTRSPSGFLHGSFKHHYERNDLCTFEVKFESRLGRWRNANFRLGAIRYSILRIQHRMVL